MRTSTIIFTLLSILSAVYTVNAVNEVHVTPFNKFNQCVAPWVNRTQAKLLTQAKLSMEAKLPTQPSANPYSKLMDPSKADDYIKRVFYMYIEISITHFILVGVLNMSLTTYINIQLAMLWVEFNSIKTLLSIVINK